jgi:hypothetical protein
MPYVITLLTPVALDVVKVTYSAPVVTGNEFYDTTKYAVYSGDVYTEAFRFPVKALINNKKLSSTNELLLCVPGLQEGVIYSVVCQPQRQVDGTLNPSVVVGKFAATRTKLDSLLQLIPSIYDKSYTSSIRSLLTSIALQLDDVGGPDKECYV